MLPINTVDTVVSFSLFSPAVLPFSIIQELSISVGWEHYIGSYRERPLGSFQNVKTVCACVCVRTNSGSKKMDGYEKG